MRKIQPLMKKHLENEVLTLASCWKMKLKNGQIYCFTDYDQDLIVENNIYKSNSGFTPSAITSTANLSVDNLEIEAVLNNEDITENDILSGMLDNAEVLIFLVNYLDLSQGIILLKYGYLGEITISHNRFIAEIRGITQNMAVIIGDNYSPYCRAEFGDNKCKINLEKYTKFSKVTGVISNSVFIDQNLDKGCYNFGKITFLSGKNKNISMEVREFHNKQIVLALSMPSMINVGDEYKITEGCNKSLISCSKKFNNVLNFRGEPHVPNSSDVSL